MNKDSQKSDFPSRKRQRIFRTGVLLAASFVLIALSSYFILKGHGIGIIFCCSVWIVFLLVSRKWMILKEKGIPILTFHSVSDDPSWLPWPYLSIPVEEFNSLLLLLSKKKYRTVSISEVRNHMEGRLMLKGNVVCLTFDDGYKDNWVGVYPLLKRFGYSGTIFMATDFIEHSGKTQKNLEDLADRRADENELEWKGYLSAGEIQKMDHEGVLDVQNHTATHTWMYKSDTLVGFLNPDDFRNCWHFWNDYPLEKPVWHEKIQGRQGLSWGHPVFEFSRAHLVEKAFFPDKKIAWAMNDFVTKNGGRAFFKKKRWGETLEDFYLQTTRDKRIGKWETDAEAAERLDRELAGSKKILEEVLKKEVNYLCWPGEMSTDKLFKAAIDKHGYKAIVGSGKGRNARGDDSKNLSRIYVKNKYLPFPCKKLERFLFFAEIRAFEGNLYYFLISLLFNQVNKITKLFYRKQIRASSSS